MNLDSVVEQLREGKTAVFVTSGNSMTPKVRSGDTVAVCPVEPDATFKKGDIVLARVNGRWYLHLISALAKGRVQIANNHGHVNGWTSVSNVVGRLVR